MSILVMACLFGCAVKPAKKARDVAGRAPSAPQIYLIFSFHQDNQIPKADLEDLLSKVNPDLVFVEALPENVKQEKFDAYRSEMKLAYLWARKNHKGVKGFDCDIETLSTNVSREKFARAVKEYKQFVADKNWRDASARAVGHRIAVIDAPLFDLQKASARQQCMLENIRSELPSRGIVLILTGVYHSDFFRKNIEGALFPASLTEDINQSFENK